MTPISKPWFLVLLICVGPRTVTSQDAIFNSLDYNTTELASKQPAPAPAPDPNQPAPQPNAGTQIINQLGGIALTSIAVSSGLLTIFDYLNRFIAPSTTAQDTLDLVRRLTDALRPDVEGQFKAAEDTISRALHDMATMVDTNPTEFQRLLWLERTRLLDGDIILLLEGLLGQQVAGGDLMENIKDKLQCDAVKIFRELNRYNSLISDGTLAFNYFSRISQMSDLEINQRRALFRERNFRVLDRNEAIVEECFQLQLTDIFDFDGQPEQPVSTDQVAQQVAETMSQLYPLPTRWIVAVYTDDRNAVSRAAVKPIKPKLSASYNVKDINGYHVAIFPFLDGQSPRMINGQQIEQFCNRPVPGAGQMPLCDVGSSDGEYVYDQLRRQGIVPENLDLIVVPSEGQLSVRTVPLGGLPPFFAKKFPDFDIVVF